MTIAVPMSAPQGVTTPALNPKINTRFSSYIKPGLLSDIPTDLKREILETAAWQDLRFALRMAVVSREVQTWAERIIYRELFFSGHRTYHRGDNSDKPSPVQRFKVALEARPAEFFAEYVRALHFDGICIAEDVLPIIRACTGVTNFGMYASVEGSGALEIARIVHSLPLHTLFISSQNLNTLLLLDVAHPAADDPTESDTPSAEIETNVDEAVNNIPTQAEEPPVPVPSSCLHTLPRLGLIDGFEYPAHRFPALTHLALIPDSEDKVVQHVRAALANRQIESIVVMLNYINAPRQVGTMRSLRGITDSRLVMFTLPVSPTRYIEDDLWDLANEFPDEEPQITYLEAIPGPRILTFEELKELDLVE